VRPALAAIGLVVALSACGDPKPGSPFMATATPDLRALFAKVCADPVTGSDTETEWTDPAGDFARVQSSGNGCSVRMNYDPRDLHIKYVVITAGLDWDWVRTFTRDTVLPMVKPHIRAYIEKNVLADLGADKDITYAHPGKGEVHYRNKTRDRVDAELQPVRRPSLSFAIGWK
jgi:hypothetical protein